MFGDSSNIGLAKPKSGARIFFSRTSQGQNALPRPGLRIVRLGAQCTDHWTTGQGPWRWRARCTVDHAC